MILGVSFVSEFFFGGGLTEALGKTRPKNLRTKFGIKNR